MSDQTIRLFHIIQVLPRYPQMTMTVKVLQRKLLVQGYEVSERTLQRDLNAIESLFRGVSCSKQPDRSVYWFWTEDMPVQFAKLAPKKEWGGKLIQSRSKRVKSSNESFYFSAA